MTEDKFDFVVRSDLDFEDLIAEIGYENNLVAILTQEEGFQNLRIRIYPPKNEDFWDFNFQEFEDTLSRAKMRLKDLQKST
jgi:hypothetical protein